MTDSKGTLSTRLQPDKCDHFGFNFLLITRNIPFGCSNSLLNMFDRSQDVLNVAHIMMILSPEVPS